MTGWPLEAAWQVFSSTLERPYPSSSHPGEDDPDGLVTVRDDIDRHEPMAYFVISASRHLSMQLKREHVISLNETNAMTASRDGDDLGLAGYD